MVDHLELQHRIFILVSLIPFVIAQYFYKNERFLLTSTTFRSNGCGIVFLKVTGISYENYKIGGDIINFFLEPATIVSPSLYIKT